MYGLLTVVAALGFLWCLMRIWAAAHDENPLLGCAVIVLFPLVTVVYAVTRFPRSYQGIGGKPALVLIGAPIWLILGVLSFIGWIGESNANHEQKNRDYYDSVNRTRVHR